MRRAPRPCGTVQRTCSTLIRIMDDPRAKFAAKATRSNEFGFSLLFAFS